MGAEELDFEFDSAGGVFLLMRRRSGDGEGERCGDV